MTTAQIPHSIKATIHQDAINRVSGFFNASTGQILNELLQNSRRSGATQVNITLDEKSITIDDDGEGIGDAQAILSFGQSGWDQDKAKNEHPAGMGLYSLARRENVTVRSKHRNGATWEVSLTPEHFLGKATAPVVPVPNNEMTAGTTVTFSRDRKAEGWLNQKEVIQEASKYYPLPVYLDGEMVDQEDFLKDALYTDEWEGVRIGVYQDIHKKHMNFHGIVIREPGLARVKSLDSVWNAQADVIDSPHLELTLPARREVVENPFMDELRKACKKAIYQAMVHVPEHVSVPRETQIEAAEMGINIPDAAPKLQKWEPETASENHYNPKKTPWEHVDEDTLVMDINITAPDQQALARAAQLNGALGRLMEPNRELIGYTWYDRLIRAIELRITVTNEDQENDLKQLRRLEIQMEDQRPDSITLTVETTDENSNRAEIDLPTDLVFENNEEDYSDDNRPLVTKESGILVRELVDAMVDAYFAPDEDGESDTVETQKEHHKDEYERTAVKLLSSKSDALKELLTKAAGRHLLYQLTDGMTATVRMKKGEPIQVTLEEETEYEESEDSQL